MSVRNKLPTKPSKPRSSKKMSEYILYTLKPYADRGCYDSEVSDEHHTFDILLTLADVVKKVADIHLSDIQDYRREWDAKRTYKLITKGPDLCDDFVKEGLLVAEEAKKILDEEEATRKLVQRLEADRIRHLKQDEIDRADYERLKNKFGV